MTNPRAVSVDRLLHLHNYVLVVLASALCVSVILKLGSIQYLELVFALDLLFLAFFFAKNELQVKIYRPFASIATSYVIFLVCAFFLAVFALRQNFDTTGVPFLQRPLIIALSRMTELVLDVFFALYLASFFRKDERLCRLAAKTYYWVGIIGGIYSIVTFPLNYYFSLNLGTYNIEHRFRGFDNEGGPYGVYLLTLFALSFVMRRRGWLTKRQFYGGLLLFLICLAGSQSKAALAGVAVLGFLVLTWWLRGWKRVAVTVTLCITVGAGTLFLDLPAKIELYAQMVGAYQQFSNLHSDDPDIVLGRVAGAVLAPRMIEEHPLAGVGWGNYPLVRDDPQYRRGGAFAPVLADAPSLGPIDYIVDLGFPLWLYLTWINCKPVVMLRRRRVDPRVLVLAATQPIVVLCGTHLNITYQWIVLAIAMGIGFSRWQESTPELAA